MNGRVRVIDIVVAPSLPSFCGACRRPPSSQRVPTSSSSWGDDIGWYNIAPTTGA